MLTILFVKSKSLLFSSRIKSRKKSVPGSLLHKQLGHPSKSCPFLELSIPEAVHKSSRIPKLHIILIIKMHINLVILGTPTAHPHQGDRDIQNPAGSSLINYAH